MVAAGAAGLPGQRGRRPRRHRTGRLIRLLTVFPSFVAGGSQVRFCAVANHLGPAVRHAIVAMDGRSDCRERLDPGLDVTFMAAPPAGRTPLHSARHLREALRAWRPDRLLTHNWGAIEWGLANRWPAPLLAHVHVEDGFGPEERDRQLRRRVLTRRFALGRATVILPSRRLTDIALGVWRLDPARVHHVPNGIDLGRFSACGGRPPWTLAGEGPVAGTVAALRPEKNLARLLRAVAATEGLRLVIVGDGPERGPLQALAASLGIAGRVAFTGHLADPSVVYRHLDMLALSSDTEQMPLAVLEAMAAGLPVAATAVGDVALMLDAANAPFVVPRETGALAQALGRLAADAALRRRLGAANRAKAAAYDQGLMFAAWGERLGVGG